MKRKFSPHFDQFKHIFFLAYNDSFFPYLLTPLIFVYLYIALPFTYEHIVVIFLLTLRISICYVNAATHKTNEIDWVLRKKTHTQRIPPIGCYCVCRFTPYFFHSNGMGILMFENRIWKSRWQCIWHLASQFRRIFSFLFPFFQNSLSNIAFQREAGPFHSNIFFRLTQVNRIRAWTSTQQNVRKKVDKIELCASCKYKCIVNISKLQMAIFTNHNLFIIWLWLLKISSTFLFNKVDIFIAAWINFKVHEMEKKHIKYNKSIVGGILLIEPFVVKIYLTYTINYKWQISHNRFDDGAALKRPKWIISNNKTKTLKSSFQRAYFWDPERTVTNLWITFQFPSVFGSTSAAVMVEIREKFGSFSKF